MKTRMNVRGRPLRVAALGTALVSTGTAYATSGPVTSAPAPPGVPNAAGAPGGVTITAGLARRHVLRGRRLRVRGTLGPALAGRTVRLQARSGRAWRSVANARTGSGGRFRASWRPRRTGRYRLRVRFVGDGQNAAAQISIPGRVYVYRATQASWYGPSLYGSGLACGGRLSAGKLGVAHKTLRCGTRVTLRYHGRSVTVPVIDRGPYVAGREWDLTGATKARLHFPATGTVWSAP